MSNILRSPKILTSPENKRALANYGEAVIDLHRHLHQVGRFPHEAQFPILKAFFQDRKKIIQGQCGRSMGKTEVILYLTWRFALTHPGAEIYIICPQIKQAKKIYWIPRRLQNYGPQKYVFEHRDSECRTVFKNGSHIILDGCENYDSLRGIKPRLVIYDEFQHHTKEFDEEVMQPNLSGGNVSLVVMGTPPKRVCYYIDFRENHLSLISDGDTSRFYVELPSDANPSLDKTWLARKKAELFKRGKQNVWFREYEGKLMFDTESAIFPYFDPIQGGKHVRPAAEIRDFLERDKNRLDYYAIFDPGTSTVFACLFVALNRYSGQVFILDEIYATTKSEMTASAIWRKACLIKEKHYDHDDRWNDYYDEAAAWFANEVAEVFDSGLCPTQKQKAVKLEEEGRPGESILDSLMMEPGRFVVSDACEKFLWEMENFVKDENGKYPTTHDHLVDCLFYFVQCSGISLSQLIPPEKPVEKRSESLSEIYGKIKVGQDYVEGIEVDFYDTDDMEDLWQH